MLTDPINPETKDTAIVSWAPQDGGGAVVTYPWWGEPQIAVVHTQNRIKGGPLAAPRVLPKVRIKERFHGTILESFHHIILSLGTAGPLWVVQIWCTLLFLKIPVTKNLVQDAMFKTSCSGWCRPIFSFLLPLPVNFQISTIDWLLNLPMQGLLRPGKSPDTQALASGFAHSSFPEFYENA